MSSLKHAAFITLYAAVVVTGSYADLITVSDGFNVEHTANDNSYSLSRDFYRHCYYTGGYEELFCNISDGAVVYNIQSDNGADFSLLTVTAEVSGTISATPDAFWDLIIYTGFFSYNEPAANSSGSNTTFIKVFGSQSFCWNYTTSILVPTNQENMLIFWGQIDDLGPPYSQPQKESFYLANFNIKISLSAEPVSVPEPYIFIFVFCNILSLIGLFYRKYCFKSK